MEALAGLEVQRQKSLDGLGPHEPDVFEHDGVTDLQALLLKALKHLLGAQIVLGQPAFDLRLVRIELAGTAGTSGLMIVVLEPMTDRFPVQWELAGDLRGGEFLVLVERTDLAIDGVRDHAAPPRRRRRISDTGVAWPERLAGWANPVPSTGRSKERT